MSDQSEQINELAAALAIAQGKITGALKDSANPFFKSKYADLASVWDACRTHLSENGLAVVQTTELDEHGVTVVTTLAHKSGQWMRGKLRMIPKDGSPQGVGSAITYARRYALAAIVGVAQVDDDANQASGRVLHTKSDPLDREHLQVDQQHAKYAKAFGDAVAAGDNAKVREVASDLQQEGEEFYRAVWSLMDSRLRSSIKKVLEQKAAA